MVASVSNFSTKMSYFSKSAENSAIQAPKKMLKPDKTSKTICLKKTVFAMFK
jgi:hypothetical protein